MLLEILDEFAVVPSDCEEKRQEGLLPCELVQSLAKQKCDAVFNKHSDCVVIGCDTLVVFNGEILGKPNDENDAYNTLKRLSGKVHSVMTGVCIRVRNKVLLDYDESFVEFNDLSDEFIINYVNGGSPMDKAGSYGIQDEGVVKSYSGSYNNVVGLPTELLKKMLDGIKND